MNDQLLLQNIRGVLVRLEETILFALIERAQFKKNSIIYDRNAFPGFTEGESLVGFLLHETERIHARLRRYTSPDEHPFFNDLPEPELPRLRYAENPLHNSTVNLNSEIRRAYEEYVIPSLCAEGDDQQYGSCAVCDVSSLQALSKRIHYGMFVAESKYQQAPEKFRSFIDGGDVRSLGKAITDAKIEKRVLERVFRKAQRCLKEVNDLSPAAKITPQSIVGIYRDWIIPATKRVEVEYLLRRRS